MIKVVKDINDFNLAANEPAAAFYFHSQACGVCNVLLPQLDEMLTNNFPKIPMFVVNANDSLELCASLTVFSFPTILIFFQGKESMRISRNINLASLKQSLERPYSILFD